MRERLVGTRMGRLLVQTRDSWHLISAIYTRSESLGTIANDQLATCLVARLCQPRKSFIDIGAHIGSVIAEVIHHDATIKIYAIEPVKEKAKNLRQKFPFVEIHECAVGSTNETVPFFINVGKSGYSSLNCSAEGVGIKTANVSLRRLDDLIDSSEIDVIKIDVEGAELGVLLGGELVIMKSRPLIMFESGPENVLGYTKESMWQWLSDHGYKIVIPNRLAHDDNGLSKDGFLESHFYPRRTTNYFAVPKERGLEVRDRARRILKL